MISDPNLLYQLFRGRPYTKAFPFAFSFTGVANQQATIWKPDQAYFEFQFGLIKTSIASAEYNICDSNPSNPFGFVIATNAIYTAIDIGSGQYRSVGPPGACAVVLVDPNGVAADVKGVLYGWEVTREGYYR